MHMLVGRTITGYSVADSEDSITFFSEEGNVVGVADGYACSTTWIAGVEDTIQGYPAVIKEVADFELDGEGGVEGYDGEYLQFYALKVVTDKGTLIIDYENSYNSCCGGSLDFYEDRTSDAGER